jgi:hypothetical protein
MTTTTKRPSINKVRTLLNRKGINQDSGIYLRTVVDGVFVRSHHGTHTAVAAALAEAGFEYRTRHMINDPRSADKDYWTFTVTA